MLSWSIKMTRNNEMQTKTRAFIEKKSYLKIDQIIYIYISNVFSDTVSIIIRMLRLKQTNNNWKSMKNFLVKSWSGWRWSISNLTLCKRKQGFVYISLLPVICNRQETIYILFSCDYGSYQNWNRYAWILFAFNVFYKTQLK